MSDRGFQHFDFDLEDPGDPIGKPDDPSLDETCIECGGQDGEHTGDCLAVN